MTQKNTITLKLKEILPQKYKTIKVLGKGSYGVVLKCLDRESKQNMAIKIARPGRNIHREASILQLLMDIRLDRDNIVKYYGGSSSDEYLVFEMLDISLSQYFQANGRIHLKDIRPIIQQLATAFDALKAVGVIHGDVKPDNIMLVDQVKQPFTVKLIDFSVALSRHEAKKVVMRQVAYFRAPEIILGLPYAEPIDIWSLGVVIVKMVLGIFPFIGNTDYDLLECMIGVLGLPPDDVLKAGRETTQFFNKSDLGQWNFKTREEYSVESDETVNFKIYSLEEMIKMFPERDNEVDSFFELLKAMFTWDQTKRITPGKILKHPFITRSYIFNSSHLSFSRGLHRALHAVTNQTPMKCNKLGCRCVAGSPPYRHIRNKHPPKTRVSYKAKEETCRTIAEVCMDAAHLPIADVMFFRPQTR
ncbi:homeodomain-interacting protein kinase 1-like [Hippocampus comes]|uniref:homeodomain-interacting protein kinase 1-like n=1 Tax=Hippocampus comes TaxID=109280 RepID=UPI00094F0731|nr:PREDICTED: homeodomain-interacting protein kinase 1-like [Hippocampus comes]